MKKIIIVNTHGISGGTVALSTLCKLLRERGVDARVFFVHGFPFSVKGVKYWCQWCVYSVKYHILSLLYRILKGTRFVKISRFVAFEYVPVKGIKEQYLPFFSRKKTIVVYPEVVYQNFLHAKNVVRWILYNDCWPSEMNTDSKGDLVICYREVFNNWQLNPMCKKVELKHFDSDLYSQYNFGKREGKCYIIRKGYGRTDLPEVFDGPIIDGLRESEIVEVFNKYKYCYCYDMQSFYARIAAVCGCIPILVPEPGKTKDYYRSENERNTPGIAWGDTQEEIEYAIDTREELLKEMDFSLHNRNEIDSFLKYIEEHFKIVF